MHNDAKYSFRRFAPVRKFRLVRTNFATDQTKVVTSFPVMLIGVDSRANKKHCN